MNVLGRCCPHAVSARRILISFLSLVTVALTGVRDSAAIGSDESPATTHQSLVPRIVNGVLTSAYPAVGALLAISEGRPTADCSATLIGCRTILTAAHCFCGPTSFSHCEEADMPLTQMARQIFFLQGAGFFAIEKIEINPDFDYPRGGDLAIATLARPVEDVLPAIPNMIQSPRMGMRATIVGFGRTSPPLEDSGLKSVGRSALSECPAAIPPESQLCWKYGGTGTPGEDSGTCQSDSGGALFLSTSSILAGVASSILNADCQPPNLATETDVYQHRTWIRDTVGADLGTACGGPVYVGHLGSVVQSFAGAVDESNPIATFEISVPPNVATLRIALNGADFAGPMALDGSNEFDLFVRRRVAPTFDRFDCRADERGPYEYWIRQPGAGVLVRKRSRFCRKRAISGHGFDVVRRPGSMLRRL
jgi:hypothetical protein